MHESPNMTDAELAAQNTFDVTGALRDKVNNDRWADPSRVNQGGAARLMEGNSGYGSDKWGFAGLDEDGYYDKLTSESDFYRGSMPENDWLLNTMFKEQVTRLLKTQAAAAKEAGFEERYGHDPYYEYNPDYEYNQLYGEYGNKIWQSLYL